MNTATKLRSLPFLACSFIAALLPACNALQLGGQQASGLGAPAASPMPQIASQLAEATRDIEEADIVKIVGGKLYALNRYKGLIILDVADPDAPVLLGKLDLRGRGVEMYVVGPRVYAILSADFVAYAEGQGMVGGPGGGMMPRAPGVAVALSIAPGPPPDFEGSQVAIIDVSNPASPSVINKINLAGYANDSRRVGDILYVVGANFFPFYLQHDGDSGADAPPDEGFAASINVADPNHVIPVERKTFAGVSLAIHVSDALILAASSEYDRDTGGGATRVQAIDISDPAGAIQIRGSVLVPGIIRNRFFMDDDQNVLRIVTQSTGFGFRDVRVYTYNLSDLDHFLPLGSALIEQGESLEAVRFDGPRGYAVTFLRVDPLFVMDLRDPANPAVTGQLTVPGFSTHIEPRGNRLVAVGIDDSDGRRPAVAYYNVEDPAHPTELGRVVLGPAGVYADSEAVYDEKAFKIVDEMGLIAIPFHYVNYPDESPAPPPPGPQPVAGTGSGSDSGTTNVADSPLPRPTCVNAVQLVDFSDTALKQRGAFTHRGRVERVGAVGGRVFALSQQVFQTVNISDRDAPTQAGKVDFFTEGEVPAWIDDCGFGIPIDGFNPVTPMPFFFPLLWLLCGGGGPVALLAIVGGMLFMKRTYGPRRCRR